MPKYETWGGDLNSQSYLGGGSDEFLEDCETFEEAIQAMRGWQTGNYAACIRDKETGERIKI